MSEIISYMDEYRTGPDVIFPIPEYGMPGEYNYGEMTLSIHGMGGVALGSKGDGTWIVEVHHKGELIYSSVDLRTPGGRTHLQAAVEAADFFAHGESDREPFGERLWWWAQEFVSDEVRDSVLS